MRIEIERDWFEENKNLFAEIGDIEMSGEPKKYYIIDSHDGGLESVFKNQPDEFNGDGVNENNEIEFSISNKGVWISSVCETRPIDIEKLLNQGDTESIIRAIGVITKKMNQIKSLLESVKGFT